MDIIAQTIVAREPAEDAPWWGWAVCLALPAICGLIVFAIAMLFPQG